jgi:hypothetical protein
MKSIKVFGNSNEQPITNLNIFQPISNPITFTTFEGPVAKQAR